MTYVGKIQNGVVVLPPEAHLPEGTEVRVELLELTAEDDPLLATLMRLSKPRPDWPEDFVENHGHYTSGEPKRT
jgi:hypothetical protein